jgi:hypothetical protein
MGEKVQKKGQRNIYFIAMSKYNEYLRLYTENKFDSLLREEGSVYWLKLRSISRKKLLIEFCKFVCIDLENISNNKLLEYIYNIHPDLELIDEFIKKKYQEERSSRKEVEPFLVSELYKMGALDWGGLYQNNLEKTIVNNYIKKIKSYDVLNEKIENEIHESLKGYVRSSWYNHWTSILIEDIFKDHCRVIPTIGLIKKVDFFIDNIPFDLKVTYFPEGFMSEIRKNKGWPTEVQVLKRFAKELNINYNQKQKERDIFNELIIRIEESQKPEAVNFIKEFKQTRWQIIEEVIEHPHNLIKWLYEKQGERRFDAANRLFLVLVDKTNLEDSWKMKRNIDLLKDRINEYLDKFNVQNINELKIDFDWIDDKKYTTLSDILFIIKE